MAVRVILGAAVVLAALLLVPTAQAAITPLRWCGDDVAQSDRVHDRMGGEQIHVIYPVPADGPERFAELASPITTDVAAIDEWWRREDPTHAPRFHLFEFPGCESRFGKLDLSFVRLPDPASLPAAPAACAPDHGRGTVAGTEVRCSRSCSTQWVEGSPASPSVRRRHVVGASSAGAAAVVGLAPPALSSWAPAARRPWPSSPASVTEPDSLVVLTVGTVRVLIADDRSLFAKTLEALLAGTPGVEVVGIAEDGLDAVGLAVTLCPDVVLMDVEMPHLDGIAATRRLHELGLRTPVIVPSDPDLARQAHEAGAKGSLTKDRIATALVPALLDVAGAPARLSGDGGAELAGRARIV